MSEDALKKALEQFDVAMKRIATMEGELAGYRNRKPEPPPTPPAPAFDAAKFRSAFMRDPIGTLRKMGATEDQIQHSVQVHVAHALGDQAPAQLQMLAQMGPQLDATHSLSSQLEALSQQVASIVNEKKQSTVRESFSALAADKTKYPHLAKALSANRELVESDMGHKEGSAEEIAATLEAHYSKMASLFGPPSTASSGNADDNNGQSKQTKLATGSVVIDGGMPTLPKPGVWDEAEHARVRDELVRRAESQQGS